MNEETTPNSPTYPPPINTNSKQLNLSNQQLTELPKNLNELFNNLTMLNVSSNFLRNQHLRLICMIESLTHLNIMNNKFTIIPCELKNLKFLVSLEFEWLAHFNVPHNSVVQIKAIQNYLEKSQIFSIIDNVKGISIIHFYQIISGNRATFTKAQQILTNFKEKKKIEYVETASSYSSSSQLSSNLVASRSIANIKHNPANSIILFSNKESKNHKQKVNSIIIQPKTSLKLLKMQQHNTANSMIIQDFRTLHSIFEKFSQNIPFNTKKCDHLISLGVNVDQYNSNGLTALHLAVIKNQYEAVSYALKQYNTNRIFDIYKGTISEHKNILHISVTFGRIQIIKLLLENEYDIDIKDQKGRTALNMIQQCYKIRKLFNQYIKRFKNRYIKGKQRYESSYMIQNGRSQKINYQELKYRKLMDKLEIRNCTQKQNLRCQLEKDLNFRKQENNKKLILKSDIQRRTIEKKIKQNLILYYQTCIQLCLFIKICDQFLQNQSNRIIPSYFIILICPTLFY